MVAVVVAVVVLVVVMTEVEEAEIAVEELVATEVDVIVVYAEAVVVVEREGGAPVLRLSTNPHPARTDVPTAMKIKAVKAARDSSKAND